MYRSHYNLAERPFEISTDTRFLWMGEKHKEALAMLKYGVLARKGFLLLTGDVGTGKTTLVNALLESLDDNTLVANITDPLLEPIDFFNLIAASFNMGQTFDNKVDFLLRFADHLRQANDDGKNVLLILDEAHRLSRDRLEQFRLLSNIELPEKKLINIFFVGQNEFNRTLMSADCRALRQRISLTYQIKPLSEDETLEYIRYRLKVAGAETEIFSRKAVKEVFRFCQGYPRLINILCDHALLTGFVRQLKKITPTIIKECSQELCLMGDTIRISSSDFFEGTDTQPPTPPPAAALPADPTGIAANATGRVELGIPISQHKGAVQEGARPTGTAGEPPAPESRRPAVKSRQQSFAFWAMAAVVLFIGTVFVLLSQEGALSIADLGGRTTSAYTSPARVPQLEPEDIRLTASDAAIQVQLQSDINPGVAKPGPFEQAKKELDLGNIDRAVRILEGAIAEHPADMPNLQGIYSEALRRQAALILEEDAVKAERLLAKALKASPNNAAVYFELGKMYTKSKKYPEAISAYRRAADLEGHSADTLFNLGFLYAAAQDYENAEKMFLEVAALKPPYLDKALFNLAAVQWKLGKARQCIHSLHEALSENPKNERARAYLVQLEAHSRGTP
jgi:type II secretory pathway predicted ATPase ExeA/Flp pilus assembly protein TadD